MVTNFKNNSGQPEKLAASLKQPPKTKASRLRRIFLTIFFLGFNVAVIAITAMNEFGNSQTAAELSTVKLKWWFLIPATLCFGIALFLNIWRYKLIFKKLAPENSLAYKTPWKIARRNVLIGRYYDNLTPAAVGGQPAQVLYLHKTGDLSTGQATAIPVYGMISLQITFILIAILCFIISGFSINPALMVAAWTGLFVNAFWPVLTFLSILTPKTTTKILNSLIKVLFKIKFVKDQKTALSKVEGEVKEYADSIKLIFKKRELLPATMLAALLFNLLMSSIPFFVLTAFGGNVNFFECFLLTVAVQSAVYFVPTPGNSGAAEGTFYVVFSALSSGYVFWAMLVWRFFSFYLYIIMGWIVYIRVKYETFRKEKRYV